jgi:amidase
VTRFLLALLLLFVQGVAQDSVNIEELTITQLQDGMAAGTWTSRSLVELYSARIEKIDRNGPTLRSVIEMNPDALAIADRLDAERKAGKVRGPLHGVPILLKDNIDTGDRMMTTAGSLALAGFSAPRDAFVVERLREAGAVILGKTNLSEWANFRSFLSTSGWSARGGQVKNPYVLDRNPCGSSSGSGVAVAANLAAAAVGTETDGSIVCPSSVNGIVGIKPTVGLVSRSGIIPISHTQDTAGPMARTVADAAVLLNAMVGVDARDASMKQTPARTPDYTKSLERGALKGARIGVPRMQFFGYSPNTDELIEAAIKVLRVQGAVIVYPADIPTAAMLHACNAVRVQGELERLFGVAWRVDEGEVTSGTDRVQREGTRSRDAVFQAGNLRSGREERAAHVPGLQAGSGDMPDECAGARDRCGHDAPQAGRVGRADSESCVAD